MVARRMPLSVICCDLQKVTNRYSSNLHLWLSRLLPGLAHFFRCFAPGLAKAKGTDSTRALAHFDYHREV
ncbi:MAG: hypothetical protein FD175_395 [Beijerinckiaceae bacterium]|nr:MAG: hypothetical protein FD175_395 [Beijerinckiaceae bacterium]